jgi:integrase
LLGASLEAVEILHRQNTTHFLFPIYANENECKGNLCSTALNKWLKQYAPDAVIHSFRHSFRDRLRNAGVQSEMIDQLGGWSNQSVGQGYGRGYQLAVLQKSLLLAITCEIQG